MWLYKHNTCLLTNWNQNSNVSQLANHYCSRFVYLTDELKKNLCVLLFIVRLFVVCWVFVLARETKSGSVICLPDPDLQGGHWALSLFHMLRSKFVQACVHVFLIFVQHTVRRSTWAIAFSFFSCLGQFRVLWRITFWPLSLLLWPHCPWTRCRLLSVEDPSESCNISVLCLIYFFTM